MEGRFGHDLSRVRILGDVDPARVGARALTVGSDIAFAQDEYEPGTAEGRWTLAHELTHVVQNERFGGAVPPSLLSAPGTAAECEADACAHEVAADPGGGSVDVTRAPQALVSRTEPLPPEDWRGGLPDLGGLESVLPSFIPSFAAPPLSLAQPAMSELSGLIPEDLSSLFGGLTSPDDPMRFME